MCKAVECVLPASYAELYSLLIIAGAYMWEEVYANFYEKWKAKTKVMGPPAPRPPWMSPKPKFKQREV